MLRSRGTWRLLLVCGVFLFIGEIGAYFYIPGLPKRSYVSTGDVNIGALLSISAYDKNKPCGDVVLSARNIHYVEAIAYAVHKINQDDDILNDTKLGLVILDDCFKETTTISQGLRFVPIYKMNGSSCPQDATQAPSPHHVESFDVLGVIGARRSSSSIAASLLFGPTQIPLVSFTSTSDELSNKEIHPYFMRVVPPDEYQAEAMIDFIVTHGWTYISAVYEEGSYGELGFRNIEALADKTGICIATAQKLRLNLDEEGYRRVIINLLEHPAAKVVVSFGGVSSVYGIFKAVKDLDAEGRFIWIGSDAWAGTITSLDASLTSANRMFAMSFFSTEIPGIQDYYSSMTVSSSPNPWFYDMWEKHFGCSINAGTCDHNLRLSERTGLKMVSNAGSAFDAVYTFAHALKKMVQSYCPDAIGPDAARCLKQNRYSYLDFLRNTSFEGVTGHIKFDSNGNLLGKYVIVQATASNHSITMEEVRVGVYDLSTGTTSFERNISWDHIIEYDSDYLPWPESLCSKPCLPGEFLIQKELPCCWECRKCRQYEIITEEGTQCEACPEFHWPSQDSNLTICLPIEPQYLLWTSPMTVLIGFFASLSIAVSLSIFAFYVIKRDARIIKASSRELSFLQLSAIALGYVTVLIFLNKPTTAICQTGYFLFCFSFNALYAPMFIKALRVHRIFQSGKTNQRPRYTSPQSQIVFSSILILIQVAICLTVFIITPPDARLSQPVSTESYVELSCQITTGGLASFLAYNLLLILLCSVLAFKTRGLPDNFNESRFVSMCVSTTLVIWLAFMPSYFTAVNKSIQSLLLMLALLLNHNTALIFLFSPKLYAVTFPNVAGTHEPTVNTIHSSMRVTQTNRNTGGGNGSSNSTNNSNNNNNNNSSSTNTATRSESIDEHTHQHANRRTSPPQGISIIGRSNAVAPSASDS